MPDSQGRGHRVPSSQVTDAKPKLGLIALDRDEVVEADLHRILGDTFTIMTTRIPLRRVGSASHLMELAEHLGPAAERLRVRSPAVVAFGCTSGGAIIGTDRIDDHIRTSRPDVVVVDPLRALRHGLSMAGQRRIALVTPYPEDINVALKAWFEAAGVDVARTISLPDGYRHYAEVPWEVIARTATDAGAGVGAVVVACTDLNAVEAITHVEDATGAIVLTSNQALAWNAARVLSVAVSGPGRLFSM